MYTAREMIEDLYRVIQDRKDNPVEDSYTCRLFRKGKVEILKKVGEEAVEVLLAGSAEGKQRLIHELADLHYHLLVLMVHEGLTVESLYEELLRRSGKPGVKQ